MSLTLIIVIITVLISYRAFEDPLLFARLSHRPNLEAREKDYFRWLTCGFVHANWPHLIINMYVLYIFGEAVEKTFISFFGDLKGAIGYVLMYVLTIIAASIPTFFRFRENPHFASVGASGAVSGVVFAFILFYPWSMLYLFFLIPCPAIIAGILYLAYSHYASRNMDDHIDHSAHLYGALFGFLFTIALDWRLLPAFLQEVVQGLPF